jgi:hypothetical protein
MFEDVAYEYAVVFSPRSTKIGAIQYIRRRVDATTGGWMADGLAKVNRVGGIV